MLKQAFFMVVSLVVLSIFPFGLKGIAPPVVLFGQEHVLCPANILCTWKDAQSSSGNASSMAAQDSFAAYHSDHVFVADGINKTTLAAAVAADCNGSTPGEVRLAPGTYNFSSSITIPSHCTIEGPRTAILNPSGNFGAFKSSSTVSDVTFEGFTLNTSGISLDGGGDHITVNAVRFHETGSTAVNIRDDASYIQIVNNDCESPQTYFCFAVGTSSAPNPADHDWTIANNAMSGCTQNCILVQSGSRISVASNTAQMIAPGDTAIEVGMGASHATVTGNVVDMTLATTRATPVGISTRSANYVSVMGNVVEGNTAVESHCYLAWHGSTAGESQAEQYVTYFGNVAANCTIGFKAFATDHFTIGAFDFQGDKIPVSLDKSAADWVELPSRGDPTIVFPGSATRIYFGGNTRSPRTLQPR